MFVLKPLVAFAAISLFPLAHAWYRPLPPCISEYQPFVQAGCFNNGPGAKPALTERMDMDIYSMTTEKCLDTCKGNGFRYAGLAYIGVCYCGQTVDRPMIDNSQCHMPCSGNGNETCGGDAAINIYQDPTFPPIEETTVNEYVALGCYTDNDNGGKAVFYRQDNLDASTMSTKTCLDNCLAGGFPFAGTEFGGECYCGVVLGYGTQKVDDSRCSMPCTGAPNEICGGPSLINIYVAKDLQSLEPCDSAPTSSSGVSTLSSTSTSSSSTSAVMPTSSGTTMTIISRSHATSPTTSAGLCTSTVVTPSGCDYSCGKWCYQMPDFHDADSCRKASAHCKLQKWSCFKHAGMPSALDCRGYAEWCDKVDKYCGSCRSHGGCAKPACLTELPAPTSLSTGTAVAPCEAPTTTSSSSSTTFETVPVPMGTGICKQPSSKACGYGPGKPLGGIDMPTLTCNNWASEFHEGNVLKLYTEQDGAQCRSFPRHRCPDACASACQAQLDECLSVYVPGVKNGGLFGTKIYGLGYDGAAAASRPRGYLGAKELGKPGELLSAPLNWIEAKACCNLQYVECKAANLKAVAKGCNQFGDYS